MAVLLAKGDVCLVVENGRFGADFWAKLRLSRLSETRFEGQSCPMEKPLVTDQIERSP